MMHDGQRTTDDGMPPLHFPSYDTITHRTRWSSGLMLLCTITFHAHALVHAPRSFLGGL